MYVFSNNTLTIPANDSAEVAVTLTDNNAPYMLSDTEEVEIDIIGDHGTEPIGIGKGDTQISDGTVTVFIPRHATTQSRGKYKGMVRLCDREKKSADTLIGYNETLSIVIV